MNSKNFLTKDLKIRCSKTSIKRFIKLFLSINDTPYWFHQTLTFQQAINDVKRAKSYLKRLLDSLEKAFPEMSTIFVLEYQDREVIHFHLIFILFPPQPHGPERMLEILRREVFVRWNEINGNKLVPHANRMRLRQKDFEGLRYLIVSLEPISGKLDRTLHWHGIRNRKLLTTNSNSSPITKELINKTFNQIFPKPRKKIEIPPLYTKRELKDTKYYIDFHNEESWEGFKKRALKTDKKVTDADYIEFRNRARDRILIKLGRKKRFSRDETFI